MYESRVVGDVHVLTPRKNLVGGKETQALAGAIENLPNPKVILDLQRIDWVSSLGVEELRRMHQSCTDRDGWLRLVYVGSRIKDVLLTTRLHWVFATFDATEEAMAAPVKEISRRRVTPAPGI